MDANRWDLEADMPVSAGSGTQTPQSLNSPTPIISESDKADQVPPSVHVHHPITTQREHFLATLGEALSVGLGLGSAVGIWACIHETLETCTGNRHLANGVAAILMGFFIAPVLENAARLFLGKTLAVLQKPHYTNATRFVDHLVTITSAFVAIGLAKGIQMQYGPLHASLGFEYVVFVVGFVAHSFLKTLLYTIAINHDYEAENVACGFTALPAVLYWQYLDHFYHIFVLVTVNLRDTLTFALYPYLMVLWLRYWDTIDPEGRFAWVAHGVNIGFFFTFFSIIKEITYLTAIPWWSPDLPRHCHHSM